MNHKTDTFRYIVLSGKPWSLSFLRMLLAIRLLPEPDTYPARERV